MKCSLCIPTYKRPENLNNLLANIVGMEDSRIAEVLIGVSYAKEDSFNKKTEHFLRMLEILQIPYTIRDGLQGLIAAKEWFKETAKEDVLLIIDDDGIIHRSYLNLIEYMRMDSVAAVSGTIQTPLDIGYYKDYSYDRIDNPEYGTLCNRIQIGETGLVEIKDKYQVYMLKIGERYDCECLVGTAMFIKKQYLNPDKEYDRGACNYEEYDYTYSAYRSGKRLIYDSREIAFHLHEATGGMREKKSKQKEVNAEYFRKKFGL